MTRSRQQDLPPFPLAVAACRRVWTERDDLLRLGAVPLLLTFALNIWVQYLFKDLLELVRRGETPDPAVVDALWTPSVLIGLASWFIALTFAVNWMRLLTLGASTVPGLGLAIGGRHLRLTATVLLVLMALAIAAGLTGMIVAMIAPIPALLFAVGVGLMVGNSVIMLRLVPVWVGIAIDAPMSFRQAWKRTAGYGLRLLVATVLISCVVLVVQALLTAISAALGLLQAAPLAVLFMSLIIQFGMMACFCAVFVLAYPRFVSETV